MFKVLSSIFLFLSFFNIAQAQSLDWTKLNTSLEAVVQEHVDTFDFLESGSIVVDENSDLSQGYLNLNLVFNSTELNLLNSSTPQRITLESELNINTTDLGANKKIDFVVTLNLKGEMLVILRHINQLFDDCANLDPQDNFQVQLCLYIEGVKNAKNATELVPALESLRQFVLLLVPGNSSSDVMIRNLVTSIIIQQTQEGTMGSLLVNNFELFGLELSGDLSFHFTDAGLFIKASGATLVTSQDYASFMGSVESTLLGVQNQDPDTLALISNYTYFAFDLLEGIFL